MSREHDKIDIRGIAFQWYPPKANSNWKKHGVSFQEASTVFADRKLLELPDLEHSEEEFRFAGLGRSDQGRILFVNYTADDEHIRIISARVAEPWERREYESPHRHE